MDEGPLLGLDDVLLLGDVGHGQELPFGDVGALASLTRGQDEMGQPDERGGQQAYRRKADQGRDERSREESSPLWVLHGPVLWDRLGQHEDDGHLEDGGERHAQGAEQVLGDDTHEGGGDQLADQHQEEHGVEEALWVLHEAG